MAAGAASDGVVNEGISHATPTGAPITREAPVGEEVEMCWKEALSINKMGHSVNVECAVSTGEKEQSLLMRLDSAA